MAPLAPRLDPQPRTVDEFLDMYDGVEGRYEFVDGEVVMMAHNTNAHGMMLLKLGATLLAVSDRFAIVAEGGLRTFRGMRFADIVVSRQPDPALKWSEEPVVAIEILSPSTQREDRTRKREEYQLFASLQHYVLISPTAPEAWLWTRGAAGWPDEAEKLGEADAIALTALDLSVPLADLY